MLDSIKDRLRSNGLLTSEIERRILEFERLCLVEIRSETLRHAVIDYLANSCPLDFFTAPASSSGTKHPVWQSLPGGILLNTVECCVGADRKIRMYPDLTTTEGLPTDEAHDAVYVATILSDTFKPADFGKPWKDWVHHLRAASKWEEVASRHKIATDTAHRIASAIRWHLGRFTPGTDTNRDPRTAHPVDFIVHELDMDFSNRELSEIFERRLGNETESGTDSFVEKEFDSASSYFQHVESKLNNLLVFFSTLLVAVITGCYYIGSGDMFKNLTFAKTPRSYLICIVLFAFTLISLVMIGVYTELRVRKIRTLEQMAAARQYEIQKARRKSLDLSSALTMVTSVPECPPYLRRPSEDWYTLLLITISSASAFGMAVPFFTFGLVTAFGMNLMSHIRAFLILEGLIGWLIAAYFEFAWFTRFCHQLDLERQLKFSSARYVFFPKHGQSFPWPLQVLDALAGWIERRHSARVRQP